MLLQWGLDQAGKDGTVVYLEASEAGLPFYYRYGAQEVDFIETLGGQCRHACLVIHPKKMNAEGS
ncbi:hypothetical protein L228DRAFT_247282 [Xylona heveae TC161]|uniref:N-acetyltransferase domain-containing protein n=1 Tax=Xylona heveae (strain CBS 132557 / TC161) TaxID=1328760 RepID=A0A165H1W1_XYLHT|nr:hypothetical protein L228DRAFT_247282 [Xylona heveae TC161]KZF22875.1 hypothetical protein L228DRAFT_247282 [Xylona heveae TC161]